MVTPSETSDPATAPAKKRGGRRGGGGGGGAKEGGKEGGKRSLTIMAINRRVAALQKLEDVEKKKKGRQRLVYNILSGIAEGSVKQPNKAAEAVLTLMRKRGGKAAADDE